MAARSTKVLLAVVVAVAIAVGGAFGLKALWTVAKSELAADVCTVGAFDLDPQQAAVASTMVAAVRRYPGRLPERAAVLALAAALQESKLRNLSAGEGDRDSVGVLQQRPSQGWGTAAELSDVGTATTRFLDALVKIHNWQRLPLAEAVQKVQVSADGSAYAQHELEAKALADALLGVKPAAISCSFAKPTKVAGVAVVARQAGEQLGIDTPRPVPPHAVRVPGAGWQTVAWFVANADRLGIEQVGYAGKLWTRGDGWKSGHATRAAVTATMYHS